MALIEIPDLTLLLQSRDRILNQVGVDTEEAGSILEQFAVHGCVEFHEVVVSY